MRILSLSPEQDSFAASVSATIERFGDGPGVASARLWTELGALGLLGVGAPDVGGDSLDLIAGLRAAGAAGCQGPFLGAVLGARVLADLAPAVADGTARVAIVADGIAAWSSDAAAFVSVAADGQLTLVEPTTLDAFDSLAGEPWARVTVRTTAPLPSDAPALAAVELARAAWLVGAGRAVVDRAAAHARARVQFGRPIGDFQAVAHPLAEASTEIASAWDSVVVAAWRLELDGDVDGPRLAAIAATRAGLIAAYASHQVHGAVGFTRELGLDRFSAGIRQMSLHPPVPTAGAIGVVA